METGSTEGDYYTSYRRKSPAQGGESAILPTVTLRTRQKHIQVDNSWVVPHSPEQTRKFQCHLNDKLCISKVGSIKYTFKYACKGPDRVTVEERPYKSKDDSTCVITKVPTIDEIQNYQDARYASASKEAWRLFSFARVEHHPPVEQLEVHLEGKHKVYFEKGNETVAALNSESKPTKLIAYFEANKRFKNAGHIRYAEFP